MTTRTLSGLLYRVVSPNWYELIVTDEDELTIFFDGSTGWYFLVGDELRGPGETLTEVANAVRLYAEAREDYGEGTYHGH